jgi:hypothetical protein
MRSVVDPNVVMGRMTMQYLKCYYKSEDYRFRFWCVRNEVPKSATKGIATTSVNYTSYKAVVCPKILSGDTRGQIRTVN